MKLQFFSQSKANHGSLDQSKVRMLKIRVLISHRIGVQRPLA